MPKGPEFPEFGYHGTSLVQFEKLRGSRYFAQDLHLGEHHEKISDPYAEKKAKEDDSSAVTLKIRLGSLQGLRPDIHPDGRRQIGQYVYSGPLAHALVETTVYDWTTGEERTLAL